MSNIQSTIPNPYFGRNHLGTLHDPTFFTKPLSAYSFEEWLENVYIQPWENQALPNGFSFMDKRNGMSHSDKHVLMKQEKIHALADKPDECLQVLKNYFDMPFTVLT